MSHTILPSIALAAGLLAYLTRITRTSLLSVLRDDFVRTARAKGLGRRAVVFQHAFRNAMLPVLSILGLATGELVGGAVVVETVFARPGIGSLLVESVFLRDAPLIEATALIVSAGAGMTPQQSQGSSSVFRSAAASRIRLPAIHQSPDSCRPLRP